MAGYSDRAFRALCIENGAAFTYTEMVSAEALVRDSEKTHLIMRRAANEERYAVQLFGGDPERMALAVPIALKASGCECIDINAGCPVPKVYKTGGRLRPDPKPRTTRENRARGGYCVRILRCEPESGSRHRKNQIGLG